MIDANHIDQERLTPAAKAELLRYLVGLRDTLRRSNDRDVGRTKTAKARGRIAQLTDLIVEIERPERQAARRPPKPVE